MQQLVSALLSGEVNGINASMRLLTVMLPAAEPLA